MREYVVVILRQQRVVWFIRRDGKFQEMQPGPDGIYRSEVFPGLWLDPAALLRNDGPRVTEALHQGLGLDGTRRFSSPGWPHRYRRRCDDNPN